MKKFFLLSLMMLVSALQGWAYDFEVDGIYYIITGTNTVSVVKGEYDYGGDITIPKNVSSDGKTYNVTAIGANAFQSAAVENVTLPEGLTTIETKAFWKSGVKSINLPTTLNNMGEYAFSESRSLTYIALPNALKQVKAYAFQNCTSLKTMNLGNQTTHIEQNAFQGTAIESVTLPSTMKDVGPGAFASNGSLKSVVINNAAVFLDYDAFYNCTGLTSVDLGNKVTGFGVYSPTYYRYGTFRNCTSLTKVVIPATVTQLLATFRGCSRLYDVTLPEGLTTIDNCAFEGCAITDLTIPASVTTIGEYAFNGSLLKSVGLPSSLMNIGNYAFAGCPLTSIAFPSSLKIIGTRAFENTALTQVTIPASVTNINSYAFLDCKSLTKVKIQNAAVGIGAAFQGCTMLTDVDLGNAVTSLRCEADNEGGCFRGCTSLTTISLPNTIKVLGRNTFRDCTRLENVTLPNALTSIEFCAFDNCTRLKNLTLPNTLQSIDEYAFRGCSQLQAIILPASLNTIGQYAFQNCSSLKNILIPEHVTGLGQYAFNACTALKSVTFDETSLAIQPCTFYGCANITDVELGKVTSIGNHAFRNCTRLESVVIPNSVESLGYAFQGCTGLKSVVIGTGLKTIGGYEYYRYGLFADCTKLTNVEIKSNILTNVGSCCFYNCRSLKHIILPASVTSIDQRVFEGCSELSHVYMYPTTPPGINANTFPYYDTPTLHVPASAKAAYTKADIWKNFTNIVAIGSEPKATAEQIAALDALITRALTLYNGAVEGNEPGNYRPGAKAAFKAVIDDVQERFSNNMLAEDVEECMDLLNMAINSFRNKQVKNDTQTDNTLAFAQSLKAAAGAEFLLPIEMNNVNAISGVQFDLYLPEGMLLSTDEYGDYDIQLSDRTTVRRHSVSARVMTDGALRVVVSSQQNHTFSGNSGTLLTLPLYPQSTMETGDHDVELKNIILTDPQETRYAAPDMKSVITVSNFSMGDVNNDGFIDVSDLSGVVCFILENAGTSLVFNAADMDGNGVVEINDYSALVNVILAQDAPTASKRRNAKADAQTADNYLTIGNAVVEGEHEAMLPILLNNATGICGLQFDLYLPDGFSVATDSFDDLLIDLGRTTTRRHSLSLRKLDNGALRILCSSTTNALFSGNSGAVLNIVITTTGTGTDDYTVSLRNIVLTDPQATRYAADDAQTELSRDVIDGIGSITNSSFEGESIYNLNGQRMSKMQKGINIVSGKKILK